MEHACEKVVVGRGPLTGLKDKRVGRRQLVLTSNQGVVQVGCGLHICHSEKLNFLMIGPSARDQRKQSSWSGKTTQYPSKIANEWLHK